ncbi:NAD(P)H-quinone oxidoreductase [Agaribacterium sp. ZY112]|uniref:NAD(P)H-quinone oxidoreductase n=1 Tax=Agaribacterium sp. ZY112 TaxID=3233574 RepID=UPI00352659C7
MKAICQSQQGGVETLFVKQLRRPVPKAGEVLIRVSHAGINRPDILQREGLYRASASHSPVLGLEVSGWVERLGADVDHSWLGQSVCALCDGGAYAEYVCVAVSQVLFVPKSMSMAQAAALPEALFTSWFNLIDNASLKEGERVLIHGAAGGLGHIALQLSLWRGARVVVTAGSEAKLAFCKGLGAHWQMNYKEEALLDYVPKHIPGKQLDLILDYIGGDYIQQHINLAADKARIIQLGFQQGAQVELNLMRLMLKRICLTGSTLRIRSRSEKAQICSAIKKNLLADIHLINVHVAEQFALADVAAAHEKMERGDYCGKLVLKV